MLHLIKTLATLYTHTNSLRLHIATYVSTICCEIVLCKPDWKLKEIRKKSYSILQHSCLYRTVNILNRESISIIVWKPARRIKIVRGKKSIYLITTVTTFRCNRGPERKLHYWIKLYDGLGKFVFRRPGTLHFVMIPSQTQFQCFQLVRCPNVNKFERRHLVPLSPVCLNLLLLILWRCALLSDLTPPWIHFSWIELDHWVKLLLILYVNGCNLDLLSHSA